MIECPFLQTHAKTSWPSQATLARSAMGPTNCFLPYVRTPRSDGRPAGGAATGSYRQPLVGVKPDVAGDVVVRGVEVHLGLRGLGEAPVAPADLDLSLIHI